MPQPEYFTNLKFLHSDTQYHCTHFTKPHRTLFIMGVIFAANIAATLTAVTLPNSLQITAHGLGSYSPVHLLSNVCIVLFCKFILYFFLKHFISIYTSYKE